MAYRLNPRPTSNTGGLTNISCKYVSNTVRDYMYMLFRQPDNDDLIE